MSHVTICNVNISSCNAYTDKGKYEEALAERKKGLYVLVSVKKCLDVLVCVDLR